MQTSNKYSKFSPELCSRQDRKAAEKAFSQRDTNSSLLQETQVVDIQTETDHIILHQLPFLII